MCECDITNTLKSYIVTRFAFSEWGEHCLSYALFSSGNTLLVKWNCSDCELFSAIERLCWAFTILIFFVFNIFVRKRHMSGWCWKIEFILSFDAVCLYRFFSSLMCATSFRVGVCAWVGKNLKTSILTWLILPVVIRLSQRLSHACLSINNFVLWNCEWLIISVIVYLIVPYYLDNRSNSRANTCANTQLLVGRVAFIRLKPMQLRLVLCWVIITVRIAFHYAINQLSFCPISFGW